MTDDLEIMIRELHDRQCIRDKLVAYCRAVDRMDRDLLLTVYHPDAIDDHGLFVGGPEEFADWAFGLHQAQQHSHQHVIANHSCELDGDVAHTETYWLFAAMNRYPEALTIGGGRYIDRFEKRNGEWRIAARKCVPEWGGEPGPSWLAPEAAAALASSGTVSRDRSDSSYERPLAIAAERVGYRFAF